MKIFKFYNLGKFSLLHGHVLVMLTDMVFAVDSGRKAQTQTNALNKKATSQVTCIFMLFCFIDRVILTQ